MQTNKITKWAALLLTFSGMAAVPLSVNAQQSLFVNGTAHHAESGVTYSATASTLPALRVYGTAVAGLNGSYSGTNITLSSTFASGDGARGIIVDRQGDLRLYDSTVTTTGSTGVAISINNSSTAYLQNINVNTDGATGYGIRVLNGLLTVAGATVATTGDGGRGFYVTNGTANLSDVHITTTGNNARGINLDGSTAVTTVTGVTVSTSGYRQKDVSNCLASANRKTRLLSGLAKPPSPAARHND